MKSSWKKSLQNVGFVCVVLFAVLGGGLLESAISLI